MSPSSPPTTAPPQEQRSETHQHLQQQDGGDDTEDSASDSDFDPDAKPELVPDVAEVAGSTQHKSGKKRKRGANTTGSALSSDEDDDDDNDGNGADDEVVDAELDSGDEATIRKGKASREKRKKKKEAAAKKGKGGDVESDGFDEDDDGGEGGLIKTRAQRAREGIEKKPLASTANATVDVDAIWASMLTGNPASTGPETEGTKPDESSIDSQTGGTDVKDQKPQDAAAIARLKPAEINKNTTHNNAPKEHEEMITIKRTYDFAGETITEEKRVPKASAEAKLYLQSQPRQEQQDQNSPSSPPTGKPLLRRPKKRVSMFEPNPTGAVKGLPPPGQGPANSKKGPKLNTIEKSKLDWAGFVDKEGIGDELDEHTRAKEGYMGRMDFLGRMETKREDERKAARKI